MVKYIVLTEELYESAVNGNAEDFPTVALDTYPLVVIGVKFVSTFVDWDDQSLVPNTGNMPELRMMLKSFSIANWNLLFVYFIISLRISSTPQAFLGWRVFILSCNSFKVIGESSVFS